MNVDYWGYGGRTTMGGTWNRQVGTHEYGSIWATGFWISWSMI